MNRGRFNQVLPYKTLPPDVLLTVIAPDQDRQFRTWASVLMLTHVNLSFAAAPCSRFEPLFNSQLSHV
jgi:hypothetical protein